MKCQQAQEWMSRAMDDELNPDQRDRLEQHIASCPDCQAVRATWFEAGDLLRREVVPVPSADVMWADVRRALRQAKPEPAVEVAGWRFTWAAALVGLALLGAGLWGTLVPGRLSRDVMAESLVEPVVEWAEAELPGTSTMVYEDAESDTVVIWLMTAENGAEAPKGT